MVANYRVSKKLGRSGKISERITARVFANTNSKLVIPQLKIPTKALVYADKFHQIIWASAASSLSLKANEAWPRTLLRSRSIAKNVSLSFPNSNKSDLPGAAGLSWTVGQIAWPQPLTSTGLIWLWPGQNWPDRNPWPHSPGVPTDRGLTWLILCWMLRAPADELSSESNVGIPHDLWKKTHITFRKSHSENWVTQKTVKGACHRYRKTVRQDDKTLESVRTRHKNTEYLLK